MTTKTKSAAEPLPRIHADYRGGKFMGVMGAGGECPDHDYLLVDLGWVAAKDHAAALALAQERGGDLADRREGRLLDANRRPGQPTSGAFWLKPQSAGNADYAWCQHFNNGDQYYYLKDRELLARVVLRVPIEEER